MKNPGSLLVLFEKLSRKNEPNHLKYIIFFSMYTIIMIIVLFEIKTQSVGKNASCKVDVNFWTNIFSLKRNEKCYLLRRMV